jgi:hypothetical protein
MRNKIGITFIVLAVVLAVTLAISEWSYAINAILLLSIFLCIFAAGEFLEKKN